MSEQGGSASAAAQMAVLNGVNWKFDENYPNCLSATLSQEQSWRDIQDALEKTGIRERNMIIGTDRPVSRHDNGQNIVHVAVTGFENIKKLVMAGAAFEGSDHIQSNSHECRLNAEGMRSVGAATLNDARKVRWHENTLMMQGETTAREILGALKAIGLPEFSFQVLDTGKRLEDFPDHPQIQIFGERDNDLDRLEAMGIKPINKEGNHNLLGERDMQRCRAASFAERHINNRSEPPLEAQR